MIRKVNCFEPSPADPTPDEIREAPQPFAVAGRRASEPVVRALNGFAGVRPSSAMSTCRPI